jgi:hypothetical protein
MMLDRKERMTPASTFGSGGMFIGLFVLALSLFPVDASGSWSEIDKILSEAYGSQTARECQDYYSSLNIPDDQVAAVRDSLARLVEAGYPSGCPKEYLRLAADLSRAGIDLDDLTNKIREGIAKKVSPERLNKVIDDRADALKEARVLTLKLVDQGIDFLDRQMTYRVIAYYLLRGVGSGDLEAGVLKGELKKYPALENLIS